MHILASDGTHLSFTDDVLPAAVRMFVAPIDPGHQVTAVVFNLEPADGVDVTALPEMVTVLVPVPAQAASDVKVPPLCTPLVHFPVTPSRLCPPVPPSGRFRLLAMTRRRWRC